MLTGDGVLLLLILGACALVVLGTLELVWPTRPRNPGRRPATIPDLRRPAPRLASLRRVSRPIEAAPTAAEPVLTPVVAAEPAPAEPMPVQRAVATTLSTGVEPLRPEPAVLAVKPRPIKARPAPLRVEPAEVAAATSSAAERGFALVKAGRFGDAAALGREALAAMKSGGTSVPTTDVAVETARLWGVIGLARQGLDEIEEARFAFEEAIAQAPGSERTIWERHLVALALEVGRRPLAVSAAPAPERIEALRSAVEWLDRGLTVAPDDAALAAARVEVQAALWAAHEATATDLVQRKEFAEARRLLDEAITDPECPAGRRPALVGLLGRALSGEARLAMTDALRHRLGGRAEEATAALARAEHALTPLFKAWTLTRSNGGPEGPTRELLVRVLDEIVDARAEDVDGLIDAGDLGVAMVHADKLWTLVRGAGDQGLAAEDLAYASGRALALFDRLRAPRPGA